ncbi:MAG: hypothetical protein AAF355_11255 [Myxococcota bacterium]
MSKSRGGRYSWIDATERRSAIPIFGRKRRFEVESDLPKINSALLRIECIAAGMLFLSLVGCAEEQNPINQVGVNAVDKGLFQGSWYYSSVVIDVDYEGGDLGTYPGDSAIDFGTGDLTSLPRIRWVIDEDMLYAYRDYALVEGGDGTAESAEEYLGHPVAAYEIESHFDIRRDYNPSTGERANVIVENSSDRDWYERQYMRVDWSTNHLPRFYGQTHDLYEVFGFFVRSAASLFIQEQSIFPDSWQPSFDFMQCTGLEDDSTECTPQERDLAGDYDPGEFYHFSFVTQDLLAPGMVPDPFDDTQQVQWCASAYSDAPLCTTMAAYTRHSFLKVSDQRDYESTNWVDSRFDRHGYFRLERPTYDRSETPTDPSFGSTDFLNYSINRHNIWRQHFRRDSKGAIERDSRGRAMRLPYAQRQVRPIVWYTTSELPAHLVRPSFEVVSDWNQVLMRTVRQLRNEAPPQYADVPCQTSDPDGYCFCIQNPELVEDNPSAEPLNPTCPGRYDPFESPEAAETRIVSGEPYDCYVNGADGAEPDLDDRGLSDRDFYPWFGASMVGTECVNLLRINTCNRASLETATASELDCQERGDMRFKFLSYVDQPGTEFLGVATLRSDPVTGEIVAGDANISGPALDTLRTFALQMYDLMQGDVEDAEFRVGEDIRSFLAATDRVQPPISPQIDFSVAMHAGTQTDAATRDAIDQRMAAFVGRAQSLEGPDGRSQTFQDRMQNLVGTDAEYRFIDNLEMLTLAGVKSVPSGATALDLNDALLEKVSPLRSDIYDRIAEQHELETRLGKANVLMPNEFTDWAVLGFVEDHADWPRARLEFGVNRLLYFYTQAHEMGHCLGLRHMFGGSADTQNYDDDYYHIHEALPIPNPSDYDSDGIAGLSAQEQQEFNAAYEMRKRSREIAGIDVAMNSSAMEYTAQWYQTTNSSIGYYDRAAIAFGYGDLVEVADNIGGRPEHSMTPVNTPRVMARYYNGGESCAADVECPYSRDGVYASELLASNHDIGLIQTCVSSSVFGDVQGYCSNFDDDLEAITAENTSPRWAPIDYRFCTDERVGTLGWCHRFDEGDSYREIVRNVAENVHRRYIFTHFRRYQADFSVNGYIGTLLSRNYDIYTGIFQNLLARYVSDPSFADETGAFGFYDQFMASADIVNEFARVLAEPRVGGYAYNQLSDRYERLYSDPDDVRAELQVPIGLGRYLYTVYQSGLTGIDRVERIGSINDKNIVLQLLSMRGLAPDYGRDVAFWTNYYDLFPAEVQQIFRGIIQNEPSAYAPRVSCESLEGNACTNPALVYMDFYRGDCATQETCRPDPEEVYADLPIVEGGNSLYLQNLATQYALAYLPTYADTTFVHQLFVCRLGQGDCRAPSATAVEGQDYVTHVSHRYGVTFISWNVDPEPNMPPQVSIGFAMVQQARDSARALSLLRRYRGDFGGASYDSANLTPEEIQTLVDFGALGSDAPVFPASDVVDDHIDEFDIQVRDLESFFNQLIQYQRDLGITDFVIF